MADEPFLLVSLEEEKAKTLAQVLSNDTARKILDMLSKREHATETEVAKGLKLPISTVHYNFGLLVKAGLVSNENFTYSEKGKQVVHYMLSNKYVIIAPKKTEQLIEKLKEFLPVVLIAGAAGALLRYGYSPAMQLLQPQAAPEALMMAKGAAADMAIEAAPLMESVPQTQEFAMWFIFGSVFALLVYFVWAEVILKKFRKK